MVGEEETPDLLFIANTMLHVKIIMIMGAKTKGQLPWENIRDVEMCSSWHLDLCAEQGSPNRSGGQMLVTKFSN